MASLQFDEYQFCPETLELWYRGETIALRPKTAVILKRLLAEPGELIDKAALLEAAWGDRWVADQNLFQAISELRRLFAPLKPIVTLPNRGYAWSLPVRSNVPAAPRRVLPGRWLGALAAVLTLAISIPAAHLAVSHRNDNPLLLSPSVQAFHLGVSTLQDAPDRAAAYFRVALQEDPDFGEAQLLLAQSLYAAGFMDQAKTEAQHLYLRAVDQEQAYLQVSVMDLLSRLDEAAGGPKPALDWAQSAWEKARSEGFACAASAAHERLVDLIAEADQSELGLPETLSPQAAREIVLAAKDKPRDCDPLLGDADSFDEPWKGAKPPTA